MIAIAEQKPTGRMKTHTVRGGGGLRLHVREWGKADGPPTEPMIDALPKDIIKKVEDSKAKAADEAKKSDESDDDKKSIKDETTKADD